MGGMVRLHSNRPAMPRLTPRRLLLPLALSALTGRQAKARNRAGRRWLWICNTAGEEIAVTYRNENGWNQRALARITWLFRDLRRTETMPVDPNLVELLSILQEQWEYDEPLLLTSGFRTPETNASLEGAAPASFHLQAQTADLIVRRGRTAALAQNAWALANFRGWGGVGFYPDGGQGGFVHVDTGPLRGWTRFR